MGYGRGTCGGLTGNAQQACIRPLVSDLGLPCLMCMGTDNAQAADCIEGRKDQCQCSDVEFINRCAGSADASCVANSLIGMSNPCELCVVEYMGAASAACLPDSCGSSSTARTGASLALSLLASDTESQTLVSHHAKYYAEILR